MSWPRAFLAVPPGSLVVDPAVGRESLKASRADMSRWMGNVPTIYSMLGRGATDADFRRMATADSPADRELAETYRNLFSTSDSAQPLRAELGPDGALTVVAGQHRTRAAQEAGISLVPVHVAAHDEAALQAVRADLETQARAISPGLVDTQRVYDEHQRAVRESQATPVRSPAEPDRARDPTAPRERSERP